MIKPFLLILFEKNTFSAKGALWVHCAQSAPPVFLKGTPPNVQLLLYVLKRTSCTDTCRDNIKLYVSQIMNKHNQNNIFVNFLL